MDDIYKNIEEYNPSNKHKILIAFDDLIDDMVSKKKLDLMETELFITYRTLNISHVYIRVNSTHYLYHANHIFF